MLSDTIDEHELATGRREEGLFFAARSFALKASFGFGAFFAGIAPQVVKFPKGASIANIPAEAFTNLVIFARPRIPLKNHLHPSERPAFHDLRALGMFALGKAG